jgi:hypothetical protein
VTGPRAWLRRLARGGRGSARPLTFAVTCLVRSGSEHLVSLLDSHPDIRCFSELFNPMGSVYSKEHRGDHHEFLRQVCGGVETKQVGCKLPWESFANYPHLLDLLHDPSLRVVRLVRPNYLAIHVSVLHVEAGGPWHATSAPRAAPAVHVERERAYRDLFNFFLHDRIFDELTRHNPVFRIEYGQLSDSDSLARLQRFLGVVPRRLSSPQKRIVTRPFRETIENYDEVVGMLEGTPWEPFLAGESTTGAEPA